MLPTLVRQITGQIYLEHFFIFVLKVNIQHFFLQDNISIAFHASTPPAPRTQTTMARHFSNSSRNYYQGNFEKSLCNAHEILAVSRLHSNLLGRLYQRFRNF